MQIHIVLIVTFFPASSNIAADEVSDVLVTKRIWAEPPF